MISLKEQIESTESAYNLALKNAASLEDLEQIRVQFLGRNGTITALMEQLKMLPTEDKKEYGPLLNQLKKNSTAAHEAKEQELKNNILQIAQTKEKHFDVTAYRHTPLQGSLHVFTHLIEQLEDIFISMGYTIADGPEVETEYHNFTALNIPHDHPARDIQDTFWMNIPNLLLRTQTSPVQIRSMEKLGVPLAIFAPGRVYRNEATDASHDFVFMQGEGLLIGKNISISHLLTTAQTFLRAIFDKNDLKIRVRPGYFPFVEPGLEIDASCPFCTDGCSTCKKTGWIELMGSGLVHPNVLRASGIDPDEYSGFAFGFGIERIAMVKYGIPDIRLFRSNRVSFLSQF